MPFDLKPIPQNYGIDRWGEGYFGINAEGHVTVRPDRSRELTIDVYRLAHEISEGGLAWPVLVRFVDILHDRVAALCGSFINVSKALGYRGNHRAVYPIKVNQQRSVIDEILASGDGCVGLESGSKPELMAILAHSPPGGIIVCNGYKDREYVRLALIGQRLGQRVYIVIEKLSELELVLKESADLQVEPQLGVRVRLASSANGKWQNSGGEKSKFGLTTGQLLMLLNKLAERGRLGDLQLLHFHIGSQIPNLRDIRRCMGEGARVYAELHRLGAPIRIVDVGGGLGVDYEGTGTRHFCSMNYNLDDYTREVVEPLLRICIECDLRHPDIFTESGRAMTAHHAMLVVNVIDTDPAPAGNPDIALPTGSPAVLGALHRELERATTESPSEVYQEAIHSLEEVRELFDQGTIDLESRALAEECFFTICHRLKRRLRPDLRRHRDLLDQLRERLADRLFCNFSLFQSLPDVWAINQIFPVMPLHRLDEPPRRSAVLHDLTCDSDGCITHYVDQDGVETSLPVHEPHSDEPYLLGIFLVGAYQEILGDMHNLFGDTNAINLVLDGNDGYRLTETERGDSVDELLRYVHFAPRAMLAAYRQKLEQAGITGQTADALYQELHAGLSGYTYFQD